MFGACAEINNKSIKYFKENLRKHHYVVFCSYKKIRSALQIGRDQGTNAREVNCSYVYSVCILKPVLSRRNLLTRIDASLLCLVSEEVKSIKF